MDLRAVEEGEVEVVVRVVCEALGGGGAGCSLLVLVSGGRDVDDVRIWGGGLWLQGAPEQLA